MDDEVRDRDALLLLSGGLDSVCLAFALRPLYAIFIDYGQKARLAERRAALAVAHALHIELADVAIDLSTFGGGLLHSGTALPGSPSPEWWPLRNQFLVTSAAAWACLNTPVLSQPDTLEIVLGTVGGDGERHADGTEEFVALASSLLAMQEGAITLRAPAIAVSAEELLRSSGVPDSILAWSHSCHISDVPCGSCPGCHKRERVLYNTDRLG